MGDIHLPEWLPPGSLRKAPLYWGGLSGGRRASSREAGLHWAYWSPWGHPGRVTVNIQHTPGLVNGVERSYVTYLLRFRGRQCYCFTAYLVWNSEKPSTARFSVWFSTSLSGLWPEDSYWSRGGCSRYSVWFSRRISTWSTQYFVNKSFKWENENCFHYRKIFLMS